jgi:hypothetical protein
LQRRLVEESARLTTLASGHWATARERKGYRPFAKWVTRLFDLARDTADTLGYADTRYDALLETYEPGLTARHLSALFSHLRSSLAPLIEGLRGKPPPVPAYVPAREFCLMGGGELAAALLAEGVVDEIGLNVHPVLLGRGIPMLVDPRRQIDLELAECRTLAGGCVLLSYQVRAARSGPPQRGSVDSVTNRSRRGRRGSAPQT